MPAKATFLLLGPMEHGLSGALLMSCLMQLLVLPDSTGLSPSPLPVCPEHLTTEAVAHGRVRAMEKLIWPFLYRSVSLVPGKM